MAKLEKRRDSDGRTRFTFRYIDVDGARRRHTPDVGTEPEALRIQAVHFRSHPHCMVLQHHTQKRKDPRGAHSSVADANSKGVAESLSSDSAVTGVSGFR